MPFISLDGLEAFSERISESEDLAVRRIHSHLFIGDPFSAVKEGKQFIQKYPDSLKVHKAYLEALCEKGEEVEAFQQFSSLFKKTDLLQNFDRTTLEWLAWGVLNKGEDSPLLVVRLYTLLGSAFTRDARAIPIFLKELQGSNALLRSLAIKLSTQYGDAPLQKELLRLLKEEKVWFVKLEAIQAVGVLRMQESKAILQEIISNQRSMAEEKGASIVALAGMYESISREELAVLVKNDRAGLRQLASEIVAHLDFREGLDLLLPLFKDSSPDVRISVMRTFGFLQVSHLEGYSISSFIKKNLKDSHPEVSITASWLSMVLGYDEGEETLREWIIQERVDSKRLASAALAVTGVRGVKLMQELIKKEEDIYTKVNLAIGLIGQRKNVEESGKVLFQALSSSEKELWMWEIGSSGIFRSLAPSKVRHREEMPKYPQVVDQLVKLDILSILSMVHYPKALEAVREFLKNQYWGVTGAAASTLLQEGDEASLELVRKLLEDSDEKIKVQAALFLSLLGGDPSAVKVLIEAYPKVDRDMKIHLLEALGHIGDPSAIPFLVDLLKEPFQGLRVVAAAALIQCLYH